MVPSTISVPHESGDTHHIEVPSGTDPDELQAALIKGGYDAGPNPDDPAHGGAEQRQNANPSQRSWSFWDWKNSQPYADDAGEIAKVKANNFTIV